MEQSEFLDFEWFMRDVGIFPKLYTLRTIPFVESPRLLAPMPIKYDLTFKDLTETQLRRIAETIRKEFTVPTKKVAKTKKTKTTKRK